MEPSWGDGKFFVSDINFVFPGKLQSCQPKATCNIALYILEKIMSLAIAITHVLFFPSILKLKRKWAFS